MNNMDEDNIDSDWKRRQEKHNKFVNQLLKNIQIHLPDLEKLLIDISGHWTYEDHVYRYYHGSFKVYYLQEITNKIVSALKSVSPYENNNNLNEDFLEILAAGTGKEWDTSHNAEWSKHCRPILEAFFHAKYFLEMIVKYGKELKDAPNMLPSGWASVLCLYKLR